MDIMIAEEVIEKFPKLSLIFFLVNLSKIAHITPLEREFCLMRDLRSAFGSEEALEEHYLGKLYDDFYRSMGLKVRKVSTPIKQAARVLAAKSYRPVSPIIDLCMGVEYSTLVSFQAYDAAKIAGQICYAIAEGHETITTFQGEAKICKTGELVLKDEQGVVHSSYYGNALRCALDCSSQTALVRLLGVPGIEKADLDAAETRFGVSAQPIAFCRLSAAQRLCALPVVGC
jgi:DNA/RNA-binding domain of Phe-tRNA-synthetase-like protein